ncbi:hypothetical protein [Desulfovibrio falkowii]|uniref:Uncharacterized protein n=1 Tax=Desulfovibrio falkowii TaxID=3136602 RepID=A0ABQ0EAC0_9BACT
MATMKAKFRSLEPEGSTVNVYGYVGTVGENGVISVTVPESLVAGELEAGRFDGDTPTPAETKADKPDKADKSKGKTKAADAADGDTSTP